MIRILKIKFNEEKASFKDDLYRRNKRIQL